MTARSTCGPQIEAGYRNGTRQELGNSAAVKGAQETALCCCCPSGRLRRSYLCLTTFSSRIMSDGALDQVEPQCRTSIGTRHPVGPAPSFT